MPHITCKECGHPFSATAVRCPNCEETKPGGLLKSIAVFLLMVILVAIIAVVFRSDRCSPNNLSRIGCEERR